MRTSRAACWRRPARSRSPTCHETCLVAIEDIFIRTRTTGGSTISTETDLTTERAEYTERIEQRIKNTLREFQDLELEQMRRGEIEARARLAKAKRGVDERRTQVQNHLHQARKASASAWDEAKAGLESAWSELRDAVERARRELSGGAEEPNSESEADSPPERKR